VKHATQNNDPELMDSGPNGGESFVFSVLFGGPSRTAGNVQLGRPVTQPLTNYSRLTGRDGHLTEHPEKDFRDKARQAADALLKQGKRPF